MTIVQENKYMFGRYIHIYIYIYMCVYVYCQVTPIYMAEQWGQIDWYQYLCIWEQLPADMKRVAELVGVQERFLARAVRGNVPCQTSQQARTIAVHKRFYTALVLHDLVNEVPLSVAVKKYNSSRGVLQSLQQSASTFAGMIYWHYLYYTQISKSKTGDHWYDTLVSITKTGSC